MVDMKNRSKLIDNSVNESVNHMVNSTMNIEEKIRECSISMYNTT